MKPATTGRLNRSETRESPPSIRTCTWNDQCFFVGDEPFCEGRSRPAFAQQGTIAHIQSQRIMCSGPIAPPCPTRMLALSITFRSSRTLPGQICFCKSADASGLITTS
jgi:hypothetical protein